jgi:hypothetical protein
MRQFGVDLIELRLRGEPFVDVHVVANDESFVPDGPKPLVSARGGVRDLRADERVLGKMADES